jgi:2-C-methyl-D-erythritol 4-phosphate cytidylyltransferase
MNISNIATIVLASGKGERFGGLKQFVKINNKAILFHTVDRLLVFNISKIIVVVVPSEKVAYTKKYYKDNQNIFVIAGGETRQESTKIALNYLEKEGIVYLYIHDGVRPFITRKIFTDLYKVLKKENSEGVVPYLPVTDSTILFDDHMTKNSYMDRNKMVSIQTPHLYNFLSIIESFSEEGDNKDEMENAQLMEYCGRHISYTLGLRENIKLTDKNDLTFFLKILS